MDDEETALLGMINAYRAETGRAALGSDATLRKAAAWLSADSARRGFTPLDHIDSLGRSLAPRLLDCADTMFSAASENVHQGPGDLGSSAGAFRGWTQSAPHNAAMLDAQYTFAGVARACRDGICHWTLDLGNVSGPA